MIININKKMSSNMENRKKLFEKSNIKKRFYVYTVHKSEEAQNKLQYLNSFNNINDCIKFIKYELGMEDENKNELYDLLWDKYTDQFIFKILDTENKVLFKFDTKTRMVDAIQMEEKDLI